MALQTLVDSQMEAARLTDIPERNFRQLQELTRPKVTFLGHIAYEGAQIPAFTGESGNFDPLHPELCRGGTRMSNGFKSLEDAAELVGELSGEMRAKRNSPDGGRKGLIVAEGAQYDLEQRKEIMARYAELMHKNGFAGPFKHIVSADMSTAGLSDAYVERFHKLDEDEPLWRAAAAAKSPNYGGLRMRGPITGEGLTAALVEAMHDKGEDAARLTFMGFGQVAAWAARYAKTQQETDLSIMGITDVDGMVTTRDRRGLPITAEMVQQIGDNPSFMGRKMAALHDALHRNGFRADFAPDNTGIFFVPTDYFVPAAGGDVIDLAVAKKLAAERGVIEGANGATSPAAHKYMVKKGLMVLPDILANRQGVNTSEVEWALNIGGEAPDEKAIRGAALEDSREQVREAFDVAKRLGTYDIRIATSAIHLQCLMGHTGLAA